MKKLFLFLITHFLFLIPFAQSYDPSKVNAKAKALYDEGIKKAQDADYAEAISLFQQAIYLDSNYVEAFLSLGGVYGQMKNYTLAAEYYEKGIQKDTAFTKVYRLPYSINLAGKGEFEKALNVVNEYLSNPKLGENSRKAGEYRKRCFEFAVDFEKKNAGKNYLFAPKNLGDKVNSEVSEYFPCLTIDGKELVFTRKVRNFDEDFFSAQWKNNEWDNAKPLGGNINTDQNEGAQMISQDGQWLVFTGCNRPDGWGSCDIYISYFTPQGWSEAINLGGTVNSDQWDSQPCLSPDKRDLYFTSRRLGGYGGSDIYVCHLRPGGKWSEPENLGSTINTKADEACPFLHADNQTLYFTSNGLPGYGEEDLYYSRKGPKGDWSIPQNLGYPVNTIDNEGTLFIAADGKTAYYSSNRSDSKGGLDIYSFELRENIRPYKTLWVKGKVFDKKTTKGLPSAVELIDLATKQPLSKVQTDEQGNYLITLPVGKDYAFNVNRKGYLFYSDNFSLSQQSPDSIFQKDIPLQPIEANATVVLKNIFFDVNKFDLKPESETELDKVVQLLNDNPTLKIQIGGHTDSIGKAADNLVLSNNRSKAVVNYLITKSIDPNRLTSRGFGSTQPVSPNKTEEGRAMNRRTEMKVVSQ
ncbi:MAG: flagellar motor protein MotB [Chitinophagaceae bacterium]|nr:MAG: flagellar motor protein MotB [Chitinophagaceae bacterium]